MSLLKKSTARLCAPLTVMMRTRTKTVGGKWTKGCNESHLFPRNDMYVVLFYILYIFVGYILREHAAYNIRLAKLEYIWGVSPPRRAPHILLGELPHGEGHSPDDRAEEGEPGEEPSEEGEYESCVVGSAERAERVWVAGEEHAEGEEGGERE